MNAHSTVIAAAPSPMGHSNGGNTTLADVAALAGVSSMTVSRVVNGASVTETTKFKVQAAIRALDYKPNLAARALSQRRLSA